MYNIEECSTKLASSLRELRKHAGYTQKEVASVLGITYQSYQAYERKVCYPSLPVLILLAEFYDVSIDSLIGRDEYL